MSRLGKLLGEPKEVEIKGEKFMIHPLKVKDMSMMNKPDATDEEKMVMAKEIIKKSLVDENPTDEEIDGLTAEVFTELMDHILELNGFKDERLTKIKERVAQTNTNG